MPQRLPDDKNKVSTAGRIAAAPDEVPKPPAGETELGPGYFLQLLEGIGASLEQAYDSANPLPRGHQRLIRQLLIKDGQTQTELATAMHIHKVSVGLYINELVEMGLVERRRHPKDGRAYCIYLTDYLHKFRPEGERIFAEIHAHAIKGLPTEEYRMLLQAMEKMYLNLQELARKPDMVAPLTPPAPDSPPGDTPADAPPVRKKTP